MLIAGAEASRTGKKLKDTLAARTLKRVRERQAGQGAPVAEEYRRETKKPKIPPFLGTRVDQMETILPGCDKWRGQAAPF